MNGVVRHVEVERLPVRDRLLDGLDGLPREGLGQVDVLPVIRLQARHVPDEGGRIGAPCGTEVLFAPVAARPARAMTGDVHVETKIQGILAWCVLGAEMRLSHVDGAIASGSQQRGQWCGLHRPLNAGVGADAVKVPVGRLDTLARAVRRAVLSQGPVRHAVPRHVHARQRADPRGGTDRRGIGLRELHPFVGEPLHVRRVIAAVQCGGFRMERNGGLLPSHVIHEEEDDVGSVGGSDYC